MVRPRFAPLLALALLFPSAASARQAGAPGEALLIRGGWIFDGTGDAVRRNPGILIRAGKLFDMQANGASVQTTGRPAESGASRPRASAPSNCAP